jgi:ABC-type lipoprotein release transport system permease subunit
VAAVARWARADIRARWRLLVGLGLIAGITTGLALAAFSGAHRTHSVLDRLQDRTNAADAIVFASQAGVGHPDWSALRARPEVEGLAVWALVFGQMGDDPEGLVFTPVGDDWLQRVDAPIVVEGRMFDPEADDEVVVAEGAARAEGVHVGDTIPFTPYTAEDVPGQAGPLQGTPLELRVVGVIRSPVEALFVTDGFVAGSPGILTHHPETDFFENAMVQVRGGSSGMPSLEAHTATDVAPGATILDLLGVSRRVTTTTDVESTALALLAAAIAVAGIVLAGQVLVRSAAQVERDSLVLRAMGLRRRDLAMATLLAHVPAIATALVATFAAAVLASRWLPMGFAATLEPDPGIRVDAAVLGPGLVLLALVLAGALAVTAWLVTAPSEGPSVPGSRGIAAWVRRHASPAVGIGATLALRPGRGRDRLSVRPALLGAVVGVLGVVAATSMDGALRDTLDHPERAGAAWDAFAAPGQEDAYTAHGFSTSFNEAVTGVDALSDVAQVDRQPLPVNGVTGVPAFAVRPVPGGSTRIELVTLSGRDPQPGEVVIGPETARSLDVGVGDVIHVGEPDAELEVVGTALFPSDVHAEFDEGMWLAPEDFDALVSAGEQPDRSLVVRFSRGQEDAGMAALEAAVSPFDGFGGPVELPPELNNLRQVLPLPKLLAVFLAVLALAALLHVLASTTKARAGEFAVLRALGFTRRSTRLIVNVQATAVFLIGLVLGAPLGVAAGRLAWSAVAERVPLQVSNPLAIVALALLIPVTLLLAQAVALFPARRVARLRTAEVLRTE